MFNKVTPALLDLLRNAVGAQHVHVDDETLSLSARDETEDLAFLPEVVVVPSSADAVAAVMRLAVERRAVTHDIDRAAPGATVAARSQHHLVSASRQLFRDEGRHRQ